MSDQYTAKEERFNILTHAIGIPLGIVALLLMLIKSGDNTAIVSSLFFGISLIVLYGASTLYHAAKSPIRRHKLRILDHSAIYILIAGTYTPLCLIILKGPTGHLVFGVVWGLALCGIVLKLFFTGRFKVLSTILYVLMGWIAAFVYRPIYENLSVEGIEWILAGGISYTTGAILYSIKKIPYNHAVFHCFVLGGSFCHFIAVYSFVL